ncbi:MAG: hypothetical protein U0271_13810 [Polyangiaceae bacterium]
MFFVRFTPHVGALILIVAGLQCAPSAPPRARDEPSASAVVASASAPPSRPATVPSATASSAPPEEPLPPTSDPKTFGCLDKRCAAGTESCCIASDRSICVPRTEEIAQEIKSCEQAAIPLEYSLSGIERCDESSDCKASEVCCDDFLWSGASISTCDPLPKDRSSPCDFIERCISSATCRVPGSACIHGACQKPNPTPQCGKTTCGGATPICCTDPPGCQSEDTCDSYKQVRCWTDKDCLPGQVCADGRGSTFCTRALFENGLDHVCQHDADCKPTCVSGKKPRCADSEIAGLKRCECPY